MADFADEAAELQQEEISAALRAHAMRRRTSSASCFDCYETLGAERRAAGFQLCAQCETERKHDGGRNG